MLWDKKNPVTLTGIVSEPMDGYPQWEIEKPFEADVFTFARVQYDSSRGGFGRGGGG